MGHIIFLKAPAFKNCNPSDNGSALQGNIGLGFIYGAMLYPIARTAGDEHAAACSMSCSVFMGCLLRMEAALLPRHGLIFIAPLAESIWMVMHSNI